MIDGSSLPFEQNVELTREVVKYAHPLGVSVEEAGRPGRSGGPRARRLYLYQSTDAVEFIRRTKVDALAISYGTMHGASKSKDVKLRKEIAVAVRECLLHEGLTAYLVSHGSSTVPQYIVRGDQHTGRTSRTPTASP